MCFFFADTVMTHLLMYIVTFFHLDPGTKDPGKKVSVMSDLIHSLNEECTRLKERYGD